jgi:hypothetical protein
MLDTPNYEIIRGHVTHINDGEFWVYDLRGHDVQFTKTEDLATFGVLPDHPVSIVRHYGNVVAARNHHTNQTWRRTGLDAPYLQHQSGCLAVFLLVGLIACLIIGALGGLGGVIFASLLGYVCVSGIHGIMKDNDEIARHNMQVDEDLQRLLELNPDQIRREVSGVENR